MIVVVPPDNVDRSGLVFPFVFLVVLSFFYFMLFVFAPLPRIYTFFLLFRVLLSFIYMYFFRDIVVFNPLRSDAMDAVHGIQILTAET